MHQSRMGSWQMQGEDLVTEPLNLAQILFVMIQVPQAQGFPIPHVPSFLLYYYNRIVL